MTNGVTYLFDGHSFCPGAGLPLTDRGFRYGMSLFETVAIRGGRPLLPEAHLSLLAKTATEAGFHPPPGWRESVCALLSTPPLPEGVVRIYLTAGDRDGDLSRVALLFEPVPIPVELTGARAVSVDFVPALPYGKTGNYWPHFLAGPASGEEAILCTPEGRLLGGAMSNLFLIVDGTLLTPLHPVRQGVIRSWVAAREAPLDRRDLSAAGAAFLTNSRFGIRQLTAIDGRLLPGHPRVETIWQSYRREVLGVG